ncbi:hypothetical protein TURU_001847 [Turdus rufiventris]|nr:hypothetical protein TURU_157458 [Turdus rufiventris]KAF4805190.1 hypothetical protein TURU_001847 [Turdus rufiventris]
MGKNGAQQLSQRRMRKSEINSSGECHRRRKEEGAPELDHKFPCSPLERRVVRQAVLQPIELCGGAEISVQSMEDPILKLVDMSGGRCSTWGNHAGADFLTGAAAQNSCWSSLFLKDCAPWKGASLEQFMKDYILWKGLHVTAKEQCEKEGDAGRRYYGLIQSPSPSSSAI